VRVDHVHGARRGADRDEHAAAIVRYGDIVGVPAQRRLAQEFSGFGVGGPECILGLASNVRASAIRQERDPVRHIDPFDFHDNLAGGRLDSRLAAAVGLAVDAERRRSQRQQP
jgi:hypothetical protein